MHKFLPHAPLLAHCTLRQNLNPPLTRLDPVNSGRRGRFWAIMAQQTHCEKLGRHQHIWLRVQWWTFSDGRFVCWM